MNNNKNSKRNNNRTRKPINTLTFEYAYLGFSTDDDSSDELFEQITKTIESIPFGKLSIPVTAPRSLFETLDENAEPDHRVKTIGYITHFNKDDYTFTVYLYGDNYAAVKKLLTTNSIILAVEYKTNRNGMLNRITRFNLTDLGKDAIIKASPTNE